MTLRLHRFELLDPLFDREFFLILVVFGKEVAVFAAQVAAVGDVNGADRILRQTESKQLTELGDATDFVSDAHPDGIMRKSSGILNVGDLSVT
jgi:hypothetical protein